jgi:hypothetical protein
LSFSQASSTMSSSSGSVIWEKCTLLLLILVGVI